MVVIVIGYRLFVTSQYDVIFTFLNQHFGEVCWHNMHIILCAPSLLVVQCVTVMNLNDQRSQVRRPEQNSSQFMTAKISGNRGVEHTRCNVSAVPNCKNIKLRIETVENSGTHSTLRQGSSQLQKHQAARMFRRIVVEQRRYAAGLADTQGWQFETYQTAQELRLRIKYARKLLFFHVAVICITTGVSDRDAGLVEGRQQWKSWGAVETYEKQRNHYQLCVFLFINNVDLKNNNIDYRKLYWIFWVRESLQ